MEDSTFLSLTGLNYYTCYSENDNTDLTRGVCFSRIFDDELFNSKCRKVSIMVSRNGVGLKKFKDNACFLSDDEIISFLKWAEDIFMFDISVKFDETRFNESKNYLNGSIFPVYNIPEKSSHFDTKVAVTIVRMLYERPFNVILRLAFSIIRSGILPWIDFTQALCLSWNSIYFSEFRSVHSIGSEKHVEIINNEELISRFKKCNKVDVQNILKILISNDIIDKMKSLNILSDMNDPKNVDGVSLRTLLTTGYMDENLMSNVIMPNITLLINKNE